MPHQPAHDETERHETTAPSNPPGAVLRPAARRAAVWTYMGVLVAFFVIVGAAFLLLAGTGRGPGADGGPEVDPDTVGTSGERMPREGSPGGFDPSPRPDSTRDELESRGAGERPQEGTSLRRSGRQGPAGLRDLREGSSGNAAGRTIELRNLEVERTDGNMFWVRDGNERAAVVSAGGMPTVRAGQRIDLTGTIEVSGQETRIRATRIDVK